MGRDISHLSAAAEVMTGASSWEAFREAFTVFILAGRPLKALHLFKCEPRAYIVGALTIQNITLETLTPDAIFISNMLLSLNHLQGDDRRGN